MLLCRELDRLFPARRLERLVALGLEESRKSFMFFSLSSTTRMRWPLMRLTLRES